MMLTGRVFNATDANVWKLCGCGHFKLTPLSLPCLERIPCFIVSDLKMKTSEIPGTCELT